MNKPHMMSDKNRRMVIGSDGGKITLSEEGDKLGHCLGDITEDCVRAVLHYGRFMAMEENKDYVQFSCPCSEWLIEVRKKKEPRYKRLFNSFKK